MVVRSIMVQDYSTGTQYVYGDQSGTWQSIKAVGGSVFSGGNKPVQNAPSVTATASGQPLPFTPQQTGDSTRPSVYPWIPGTSSAAPQPTFSNYPGLPAGWSVSDTGKVVPPSSAPVSKPFFPHAPVRYPPLRHVTNKHPRCPKPLPLRNCLQLRLRLCLALLNLQSSLPTTPRASPRSSLCTPAPHPPQQQPAAYKTMLHKQERPLPLRQATLLPASLTAFTSNCCPSSLASCGVRHGRFMSAPYLAFS
jgi:hypothetical protein